MSVDLSRIKFNTIKEYIVKYIILKIQSQEWDKGKPIPSERWFMIKFSISKSMISSILSILRQYNIIFSIPKKGNFVSKNENAFLASAGQFYNSQNIEATEEQMELSNNDIEIITKALKDNGIHETIDNNQLKCYQKKYFKKNQLGRNVFIFVKNNRTINNELDLTKQSIFKMMAYRGTPLVKKIEIHSLLKASEEQAKVFPKGKREYLDCIYEIYWNYEGELSLIMKIFVNPVVDHYYSPRLFNLLQK